MAKFHPLEAYYRQSGMSPTLAYRETQGNLAWLAAGKVAIIMKVVVLLQFFLLMTPLREQIYTTESMTTITRFAYGCAIGTLLCMPTVFRAKSAVLWVLYVIMCGLIAALALL